MKGMLVKIQSTFLETKETICMSGTGNLGRKRVEWRRNANLKTKHFPKDISLEGLLILNNLIIKKK